jgi:hypothetical protein
MDAIVFKAYFINKLTYWLFPIIVIALAVIYLKLNLSEENRTMACGASIGVGFIVILYLNRFDPKLIKFDKENIEISYISQPPYGKKKGVYSKKELAVLKKNDLLILSNKTGIVAKMRRKALEDAKDWETLENYFA